MQGDEGEVAGARLAHAGRNCSSEHRFIVRQPQRSGRGARAKRSEFRQAANGEGLVDGAHEHSTDTDGHRIRVNGACELCSAAITSFIFLTVCFT